MAKLKVSDVVEIKRMLQEDKYMLKEIAEMTGRGLSTIKDIKGGYTWSHVQIDENGEFIPFEADPLDYPVEYKDKKSNKVDYIHDWTTKHRIEFIDNYFIRRIKRAIGKENSRVIYEPSTRISKNNIFGVWKQKKWLFNYEWDDFISFIILVVANKTMTFEPRREDWDWSNVNESGTTENNILHGYMAESIKWELDKYANSLNNTYRDRTGGEVQYVRFKVKSTDQKIGDGEEEDDHLIDAMSDRNNPFVLHGNYYNSPFLRFFKENMNDILTKEQVQFLSVYPMFANLKDFPSSYIQNYKDIVDKPFTKKSIDSHTEKIKKRVEKAYDGQGLSLRDVTNKRHIELLDGFNKAEDREEWLNEQLENSEYISNLIHDNLSVRDTRVMSKCLHNGFEINEDVMGKIHRLINNQIDKLNKIIKGED